MEPIVEVKIKKGWSYFLLGFGFLIFIMGVLAKNFVIITNSIFPLFIGFQCWNKVYFSLSSNQIVIPNLKGNRKKIYQFNSLRDVYLENGKVYYLHKNQKKRIVIYKFFSDKADWETFIQMIKK